MIKNVRIIKGWLSSCILICSILTSAQNLEQTFQLASTFQQSGNDDAAIDTYLRVIYFDDEEVYTPQALLNTAHLYFKKSFFRQAALFYQRAAIYFTPPFSTEIFQYKIHALLSAHMYNAALEDLYNFNEDEFKEDHQLKTFLLQMATAYYGLQNYESSKSYFIKLNTKLGNNNSAGIEHIFKSLEKKEKKNENLAYYMSAAIPGMGQFYAGDIRNGLNSFILSGGLLVLGIYTGVNYGWIDAGIIVAPWWTRYHLGGAQRAQLSVRDFKINQRNKHYLKLLESIQYSN
jgi:tetratricopeptide (TPR) repeat protein